MPSLYLAESLPFTAAITVSVMMYKSFGLSDSSIAFWTSWLLLPWSLKPFFSPFLEHGRSQKGVVVLTQMLAGVAFAVLAFTLPLQFWLQASLAVFFVIAFNCAVHDVAADGLYIDALSVREQAKYVGFQSGFWNVGQVVAQGGLTILAGYLEAQYAVAAAWLWVWAIFAALMLSLAAYHWVFAPGAKRGVVLRQVGSALHGSFKAVSVDFFLKKNIWWLIAFSVLFRSAEGQVGKIAQLFMRAKISDGGLGLSTADVGLTYGAAGTLGMIAGSLVGGWFAARVGLKRALLPLALIMNVPNVLFTYLAYARPEALWIVTTCVTLEKFALGMGFVAMSLVMMQQMAPGKYSTAHFGYATALMGLGMMIPSMASGFVSDALGYKGFFVYILLMGIPSVLIAARLPLRADPGSPEIPDGEAGETLRSTAWATALAAGSLYLFVTFSGLVSGPLLFGGAIFRAQLWVFAGVAGVGGLLLVAALRVAWRVRARAGLAFLLTGLACVTWGGSFVALLRADHKLDELRHSCSASAALDACDAVCTNDGDYDSCRLVMATRAREYALQPRSAESAARALAANIQALSAGCFTEQLSADCLSLGDTSLTPEPWLLANPELRAEPEAAKRYYEKACALGAERGCAAARALKAEIAANLSVRSVPLPN